MEVAVSTQAGSVPVTVVKAHGEIDASNYKVLLNRVEELIKRGAKDLLIDLSDVPFMSSAGLVALHSLAMMLRGQKPLEGQSGWSALKSTDRMRELGKQQHIKLLNPQPYVADTFEKAGFLEFFEIHTELKEAVASFKA